MSKGGNKTQTTTSSEPSSLVKPYLTSGYKDAESLYKQGAPAYYSGQTTAPMSGFTMGALDSMAQRGSQGSDLTRAAQGQLTGTLSGDYLNGGNPAFQGALNAAIRPMQQTFQNTVMPGIDSNFSGAGRYGSGAHAMATGDAANDLMTGIGDVSSQMAYQNYSDERQNQIRGMLFAPELANQDYRDIEAMGQAGQGFDQYNQNLINADIQKYNYTQNKDWNFLNDYIGLLNGATGSSSTTTSPQQSVNPFTGALGGAFTGASIGSAIPGIGTGIGALGGGAMGLLGSLW